MPLNEQKFRATLNTLQSDMPAVAKAGDRDYYLNEVLNIADDYAFCLRGKTASLAAPVVVVAPPVVPVAPPAAPLSVNPNPPPNLNPPPVVDKGALRRAVEVQILELERAIDRTRDEIAGYDSEIASLQDALRHSREAADQAQYAWEKVAVSAAIGYSAGRLFRLGQDKQTAEVSLNANRDQLTRLRQQLIELHD